MISHYHKCIFVHIPKTAGTSIEWAFLSDLGMDNRNRHALLIGPNTNLDVGPRRVTHLKSNDYVSQHFISQELYNQYFKFSFVRNPYHRLFSIYRYKRFNEYLSFDSFVQKKLLFLTENSKDNYFYKPQYDYLYYDDQCTVDFVGKFEDIQRDFVEVKGQIGNNKLVLQHHNKTKRVSRRFRGIRILAKILRDFAIISNVDIGKKELKLSAKSLEIINSIYSKDFEKFGYTLNEY